MTTEKEVTDKVEKAEDMVEEVLEELEDLGCIIFAKGHYVPISAILYPQTLEYIFYKERRNKEDKEKMAKDLISYFEDNKMGNIVEIDYE